MAVKDTIKGAKDAGEKLHPQTVLYTDATGEITLVKTSAGLGLIRSEMGENDRREKGTMFDAALNGIESFLLALHTRHPGMVYDHAPDIEHALAVAYEKICNEYDED